MFFVYEILIQSYTIKKAFFCKEAYCDKLMQKKRFFSCVRPGGQGASLTLTLDV